MLEKKIIAVVFLTDVCFLIHNTGDSMMMNNIKNQQEKKELREEIRSFLVTLLYLVKYQKILDEFTELSCGSSAKVQCQ